MSRREHASGGSSVKKKAAAKPGSIKVTKVIKGPRTEKHTPSSYLTDMQRSTEEKLALTTEMYPPKIIELLDIGSSLQKDTSLDVDQALFQPFPSEVTFQQFEPHKTYEFPLQLRNNDRVARAIKVTHQDSPYFSVSCQKSTGSKVAPGMETTCLVSFTPDERKDYQHELVCITEREKFVVPVRAIGARALLDFPDEINFSAAPVKCSSSKTVLVRNVGNTEAKFTVQTQEPFSVSPCTASLAVAACMQVTVDFTPRRVGDHTAELAISYNTGEEVYTQLYGSAKDINVRLDRSSVTLEQTYIGLGSQRSVLLSNRSETVVHFQWKAFASPAEEELQREIRAQQLAEEELLSKETFYERCVHNPSIRDRLPILTRSLETNRCKFLDHERFLYADQAISIEPIEGDIWPNSQAEISVVFQPDEATSYSRVAYCDVTGRESRLPLRMKGEGLPPRLRFSFDTLDIQNVFVNSAHAYEVVLENVGAVDGVYSLVPPNSLFGPKFTFAPSSGVIQPDRIQAIQISFCSTELGQFSEEFQWQVEGAPEPLTLHIRGIVIGPTFQFDVPQIKFGTVSYGFLTSCEVTLSNTSEIPMTYHLRVPGEIPSLPPTPASASKAARSKSGNKEFELRPQAGTLPPNFHQSIKVSFTPASVKSYSTALLVDVDEVGKEVYSLPITAKSVVPAVSLLTPLLDYGRCFLHHPYVHNVELKNDSKLPVKYEMPVQVNRSLLVYSTTHPRGVIEPNSVLKVPLQVEAQLQGELSTSAVFNILGSSDPPVEVGIYCIGEGPVVCVSPSVLAWGTCPVLTPLTMRVTLSNESLIPAEFECALAREKTIFTVDPVSAVIPPNEKIELTVTALIDDCLKFTDKLTILVSSGVSFTVELSAEGRGTTIVSHPPMQPSVELGPHFSRGPCHKRFTLTNRGRRLQALSWTTDGFSAAKLKRLEIERSSRDSKDMALKHRSKLPRDPEAKKPLFQVVPDKCVLEPYQSIVVTLEGCSQSPQPVNERLLCHAIIGKNPHKERIMTVDVSATFIAPLLEFNKQELIFKIYQPPGSKLTQHFQELSIGNVSPLPVTTVLLCAYPFSMLATDTPVAQMELSLEASEASTVRVVYDSTYCVDKHTRIEDSYLAVAYKEHPQRDRIALKSEVHFPNLEFEDMEVNFGCILNDTETVRVVRMSNCSPLEVKYSWAFLRRPPVRRVEPALLDEGVDMESECESDSLQGSHQTDSDDEEEDSEEEGSGVSGEEQASGASPPPDSRSEVDGEFPSEQGSMLSDAVAVEHLKDQLEQQIDLRRTSLTPVQEEDSKIQILEEEEGSPPQATVLESGLPEEQVERSDSTPPMVETTEIHDKICSSQRKSKRTKQPWELTFDPFTPISIEQIFDILPLHGTLQPGESQPVQFTFYGHAGVSTEVTAVCRVEGGPAYQLRLAGEASDVQYRFSTTHIDFGCQLYDQVHTAELVLYNSGKVDLDFHALGVSGEGAELLLSPGEVSVAPVSGRILALEHQKLTLRYFPGVPAKFNKTLQIQVAHFEPDVVTVSGEGIFPRIAFNLPQPMTSVSPAIMTKAAGSIGASTLGDAAIEPSSDQLALCSQERVAEIERLMVEDFALQRYSANLPSSSSSTPQRRTRPALPDYHLDFGFVVYGLVVSRTLTLTNAGHCPVSFNTATHALEGSGFSLDLGGRVRSLPETESLEFTLRFDPAATKSPEGRVEVTLPFNLVGGPVYRLKLSAEVTRPNMDVSSSHLEFGTVVCGQSKIVSVRLSNPYSVRCDWSAVTEKPVQKIPKHVPLHVRKKMKHKPAPKFFEVEPSSGTLLSGQSTDVRVKFMPSEELHYVERIPLAIRQNTAHSLTLHLEGMGSEPRVEFDKTLVEFPPVLPFAPGVDRQLTISNPMPYPVEIYSLEFDKQYLKEEEVLQWVKGYDSLNRLFLPPTSPGESLPSELMEAFDREQQQQKTRTELVSETNVFAESGVSMEARSSHAKLPSLHQLAAFEHKTPQPSSTALISHPELSIIESISALTQATGGGGNGASSHGDLELSPVAMSIARHLGIDLSPEAAEADNRRGLAVILHGPQSSGRSTQARILGERYGSAVIAVDQVLIEAISNASTPAGCKAREYCIQMEEAKAAEVVETAQQQQALAAHSKKQIAKESSKEKDKEMQPSELQPSPVPRKLFQVQPLPDTQYAVLNGRMMPAALPEELIVEMLSDRLQHSDCRKGVIVDGLESDFTPGLHVTTALILRALNNRKSIYVVLLEMELQAIVEREERIERERIRKILEIENQKIEQKKLEQQKIEALLNMDEDEYECLSPEQQWEIDQKRLERKKERRLQRQREKEEQERIERERKEEEERRLEEEKMKKKGKKDGKHGGAAIKPPQVAALAQKPAQSARPESTTQSSQVLGGVGITASVASIQSGAETPGGTQKRKSRKLSAKPSRMSEEHDPSDESQLDRLYRHYKQSLDGVKTLLENWDRQKGAVRAKPQLETEEVATITPSRKGKGGKQKDASHDQDQKAQQEDAEESREGLGVPLIEVEAVREIDEVTELICSGGLPSVEELLEGMGLGPSGAALAKPVTLQVHPYPLKRRKIEDTALEKFVFVATSPDDPNAPKEEIKKTVSEVREEAEEPAEKQQTPSRMGKRAGSVRSMDSSESGHRKASSHKTAAAAAASRKRGSIKTTSPVPQMLSTAQDEAHVPATGSEVEISKPTGPVKLVKFRWVVPAKGETKIKLHFSSQDRGQFDHTLNFELAGTRRRYQLFCRGLCVVPSICSEPRIVFANRKKTLKSDEIVHKRYVMSKERYYFGPLHCGKTRDRYKEGRYPENMETVTISNTSLMAVEVAFYFQHDHNAQTFLLEPPNMALDAGESKDLTLWAYPKSSAQVKDALVCCVKHNPDPVIFNICCDGVEPELKVDRKTLEFKKVLLHRKQTNVLHLHNHTLLPVAWKLSGLEQLGDEFSFSQDHGIVQPRSKFPLHVHFRASKQVNYTKKAFKIEVSDVEQIMGLMHVEPVQIMAEAYDVALDVSFPRGTDGGLDFQCIKVGDEQKLVVQMKNKGKFDIGFKFIFEPLADKVDYSKTFTLTPSHSTLYPGEKAQPVNVVFKTSKEICIKDLPVLKCQVIDAHVGDHGEVIANIPIMVTAKAIFSKFSLSPINDINFGCMVVHTRKACTFTLENKGEFEFKYAIIKKLSAEQKKQRAVNMAAAAAKARTKSREGREGGIASARSSMMTKSGAGNAKNKEASLRTEVMGGSQRLVLGMFTVTPAMGPIQAGQSQTITVDCVADKPGSHEEILSVEISDRQKDSPPVTYKICGEVLIPGINTTDMASVFEEHRVCQQLGALGQHKFHEDGCVGVYGEEERRFVFKSVIVGQRSQARFKVSNPNKIPCDVQLSVKPVSTKQKGPPEAVFDVSPSSKVTIPAHSHVYATVSFSPTAMQSYSAVFEVVTDGVKGKGLMFDLQGEGNLPQIAVVKPTIRNAKGNVLLLFKRLLLHQSQCLPLVLRNTGTIPAMALIETLSGGQLFKLMQLEADNHSEAQPGSETPSKMPRGNSGKGLPPVSLLLPVGSSKELAVVFQPNAVRKSRGELCVRIQHNQFEQLPIQLIGEGYEDDVCIENIRGQGAGQAEEVWSDTASDEIEASSENHLQFGCLAVGQSRQLTFTLFNHSSSSAVRFEWPSSRPSLSFSPAVGHLKPACSKDVTASFKSSQPLSIKAQKVFGRISKISYSKAFSEVPDWDDRMKSVCWVNTHSSSQPVTVEGEVAPPPAPPPAKRKLVKTEPEPVHSVLEERDMELFASALADFAKYDCPVTEANFKDTNMYMSRVYSFPLTNTGSIPLVYEWSVVGANGSPLPVHSSQLCLDDAGSIVSEGGELMPFSIAPESGEIDPGKEQIFSIKFAPLDVLDLECKFQCNVPNLDGSCDPLEVVVRGNSLMPYCHFDLESSDYLSQRSSDNREPSGFSSSVAAFDTASTRIIEFNSCGVGTKIVKRFHIINPTSSGYDFLWSDEGGLTSGLAELFTCVTPQGHVAAGKKYELVFEYLPKSLAVVESLWQFCIPSLSLSQTFLLVGHTVEPAVSLDRAYLSFKSMLLGSRSKEVVYLLNSEPVSYQFSFSERSCLSDGHNARLVVSPMSGTIQPHAKLPVEIAFKAVQEKEYNFNLKCSVKKKPTPLVLNVKADGYGINTALSYSTPEGEDQHLPIAKTEKRIINFGQVAVNERAFGQISVFNNGQFSFEYRWVLSEACRKQGGSDQLTLVTVAPSEGVVEPNDRARCELSFSPPCKTSLKGCEITLEIVNGPSLPIILKGTGVEPQVDFSFTTFDFGPCFLQRSDMPGETTTLTITNNDKKAVNVNSLFTNKQQHLAVQFEDTLLQPGQDCVASVEFKPRETLKYDEEIVFELNGLSRKSIHILGEGAKMKLDLANPANKMVNFGALMIGRNEEAIKTAKLVNQSPIPISFTLSLLPSSSVPALQQEGVFSLTPEGEVTLKGNGGSCDISIAFRPKQRVPQFSEEVTLECSGVSQPLLVVTGSCHGLEVTLDSSHVPFGAVVQHSQSSRRILMVNSGDIGARFSWEKGKFAPDFTISPTEGYVSPGMEVPFDITFHPCQLNHDVRYDNLKCHIEGSTEPRLLTLSGMCIEKVPFREMLCFTTNVRSKETRHLTIHNKSSSPWLIRPVIDGEFWNGPDTLSIEPNQAKHYELTYHPLAMSTESQKHHGSIFFPLPDGTGLLYHLQGSAEPPKHAGAILQEVPCKTSHTELLAVENWLRRPQRFRVTIDMIRPEKLDRSVSLHGLEYIDVPALGRRDYKLKFYSFKECSLLAKVTFLNEQTREYLFYHVNIKSTPPGIMQTIELCTPVRKSTAHTLTILNPLPAPVTVHTNTSVGDINLPANFIVGAQSEGNCMFEYLPLKVGEITGRLTLNCSELGLYQYELRLVATRPPPERPVHFTTHLGSSQLQQCRFVSYARGRTEYICKIDSSDFHVDRTINVASSGASADVTFEPSHLGDTHATLSISSSAGGEYTIPLHGHCLSPKPQGPFTIKPGSSASIQFKNVFTQTAQFSFAVNNPAFVVKASDNLKPRKTYNILVTYDAKQADSGVVKTGKLVVTSQHSAGSKHGGISWVYYLKGASPS